MGLWCVRLGAERDGTRGETGRQDRSPDEKVPDSHNNRDRPLHDQSYMSSLLPCDRGVLVEKPPPPLVPALERPRTRLSLD